MAEKGESGASRSSPRVKPWTFGRSQARAVAAHPRPILFGGAEQLVLNVGTGEVTGTRFVALPGGG